MRRTRERGVPLAGEALRFGELLLLNLLQIFFTLHAIRQRFPLADVP